MKDIHILLDNDHMNFLDFIKKAYGFKETSECLRFCIRFTTLNLKDYCIPEKKIEYLEKGG